MINKYVIIIRMVMRMIIYMNIGVLIVITISVITDKIFKMERDSLKKKKKKKKKVLAITI